MEERDLRTQTLLKMAAGVMLTISVAACSSDDDAEPSVQDAPAPATAAATTIAAATSAPSAPRAVTVRSGEGEAGYFFEIERTAVGSTGTVEFTLTEEGAYEIYCTLPGHADRGQRGTLNVTRT
jgi:hypothetical protein